MPPREAPSPRKLFKSTGRPGEEHSMDDVTKCCAEHYRNSIAKVIAESRRPDDDASAYDRFKRFFRMNFEMPDAVPRS